MRHPNKFTVTVSPFLEKTEPLKILDSTVNQFEGYSLCKRIFFEDVSSSSNNSQGVCWFSVETRKIVHLNNGYKYILILYIAYCAEENMVLCQRVGKTQLLQ